MAVGTFFVFIALARAEVSNKVKLGDEHRPMTQSGGVVVPLSPSVL